ncbi:hypothetical protein RF11_15967 [Thelohanellus kitauei]|uniref:Transmembrane protein n=1 Tax=Thelohanellus kitauei TaxID=669202 RepID=A0A0C2JBD4_THEKT|nr:hypothetical protein RF11_15967 [Thelohanellus kitauei]
MLFYIPIAYLILTINCKAYISYFDNPASLFNVTQQDIDINVDISFQVFYNVRGSNFMTFYQRDIRSMSFSDDISLFSLVMHKKYLDIWVKIICHAANGGQEIQLHRCNASVSKDEHKKVLGVFNFNHTIIFSKSKKYSFSENYGITFELKNTNKFLTFIIYKLDISFKDYYTTDNIHCQLRAECNQPKASIESFFCGLIYYDEFTGCKVSMIQHHWKYFKNRTKDLVTTKNICIVVFIMVFLAVSIITLMILKKKLNTNEIIKQKINKELTKITQLKI